MHCIIMLTISNLIPMHCNCVSIALHNYNYQKQCNLNALHSYAYHEQFNFNALLIYFSLHNNANISNAILTHSIIMLIINNLIPMHC